MSKDKTAPEAPAETRTGPAEKLMYIGPTILDPIMLSHRSVFNALPDFIKKQPGELKAALSECFVPLNKAAAALRELEGSKPAGKITEKYKTAQRLMRSKK